MRTRHVVRTTLAVAVVFLMGSGVGLAQSRNCDRVGTWFGLGDSGTSWMAIDTRGSSDTVGMLSLDWVLLDPTLGGYFPDAVDVTGAKGVWEKVNQSRYKYTWVAYSLDAGGQPVFVARASGFATMAGCNHVDLTYMLELFAPDDDMWSDPPSYGVFTGTGVEDRMPVVVAAP